MTASWLRAKKHNSSRVVVHKRRHEPTCEPNKLPCASPARVNIWLTLRSGYYLAQISRRRVGGLAAFSPSPIKRQRERGREREENAVVTGWSELWRQYEPRRASLAKRVKDALRTDRNVLLKTNKEEQNRGKTWTRRLTYLRSRRVGISKLWIWHGREVPQYPEFKRDWGSPLSRWALPSLWLYQLIGKHRLLGCL